MQRIVESISMLPMHVGRSGERKEKKREGKQARNNERAKLRGGRI
jgi:hypothetical protein